jgi:hypothetical protein
MVARVEGVAEHCAEGAALEVDKEEGTCRVATVDLLLHPFGEVHISIEEGE